MNELLETAPPAPKNTEARPLTVIEHAMRTGATPEQLQSLLELQVRADNHALELMRERRRMDEEDRKAAAVLAFRRDFAAFRGRNIIIPKSKFVDRGRAGSFYQADYADVMTLLSAALSEHGFSLRHDEVFGSKRWMTDGVENDTPWVYVTCYLEHKDGHTEALKLEGPPADLSANTPMQNMQAGASYLKRQSVLALTGTATADEDDENRMHKKQAPRNGDEAAMDAILQAGKDAAMSGSAALTKWWGALTGKQRNEVGAEYMKMKRAAEKADAATGGAR